MSHFWKGTKENFQKLAHRLGLKQSHTSKKNPEKKECSGDTPLKDIPSVSEESNTVELQSTSHIPHYVEPVNLYDPNLHFGVKECSSPIISESVGQTLPEVEQQALEHTGMVTFNRQNYHAFHLLECHAITFGVCGDSPAIVAKMMIEWSRRFVRVAKNAPPVYAPTQNLFVLLVTATIFRSRNKSTGSKNRNTLVPNKASDLKRVRFYPSNCEKEKPIGWVMLPMPVYDESPAYLKNLLNLRHQIKSES